MGLQMKYFVLKPSGNNAFAEASRVAMVAYAASIITTDKDLAYSLNKWALDEGENAAAAQNQGKNAALENNSGLMQLLCDLERGGYHLDSELEKRFPVLHDILNAVLTHLHQTA